jgi:hypothetical protein
MVQSRDQALLSNDNAHLSCYYVLSGFLDAGVLNITPSPLTEARIIVCVWWQQGSSWCVLPSVAHCGNYTASSCHNSEIQRPNLRPLLSISSF